MDDYVLFDEFRLSIRVPTDLDDAARDAIRRILESRQFRTALRRAIRKLVRKYPGSHPDTHLGLTDSEAFPEQSKFYVSQLPARGGQLPAAGFSSSNLEKDNCHNIPNACVCIK